MGPKVAGVEGIGRVEVNPPSKWRGVLREEEEGSLASWSTGCGVTPPQVLIGKKEAQRGERKTTEKRERSIFKCVKALFYLLYLERHLQRAC